MIRKACLSDRAGLSRLLDQLEYPGTEPFLEARLAQLLADPNEILLVWEEPAVATAAPPAQIPGTPPRMEAPAPEARILAFLSLHFIPQIALRGDFARISYFAVDGTARSAGIGRQLEEQATALARERGCELIEVHCHTRRTRAHDFYYRQGYEESPKYLIKRLK